MSATVFTPELIARHLKLAEEATHPPIKAQWDWNWGLNGVYAWIRHESHKGDKLSDLDAIIRAEERFTEAAYNNYAAALKRIAELEKDQKWCDANIPPLMYDWVLLEVATKTDQVYFIAKYSGIVGTWNTVDGYMYYPKHYPSTEHGFWFDRYDIRMDDILEPLRWRKIQTGKE